METTDNFFTESKEALKQYVSDRILLLKMETTKKLSKGASSVSSMLVIGILGFFALIFLSVFAGCAFAELTHSWMIGFGIVAGIYLLLLLIVFMLRKKLIEKVVTNAIISGVFGQPETKPVSDNEN